VRTIDPMKGVRELIGGLVILGASGCTNQFLANYQGARLDPVSHAKSVTEKPADCGLIGTSTFVSAGSFGEPEAVAAASEVGAEFVQWSKGLDANDGPAGAGVVRASLSPTGPVSSWAPVQPGQFLYRYVARFYRRGAKDSVDDSLQPITAERDAATIIEDDEAATQEASGRAPSGR